jgi:hypothetical protein
MQKALFYGFNFERPVQNNHLLRDRGVRHLTARTKKGRDVLRSSEAAPQARPIGSAWSEQSQGRVLIGGTTAQLGGKPAKLIPLPAAIVPIYRRKALYLPR